MLLSASRLWLFYSCLHVASNYRENKVERMIYFFVPVTNLYLCPSPRFPPRSQQYFFPFFMSKPMTCLLCFPGSLVQEQFSLSRTPLGSQLPSSMVPSCSSHHEDVGERPCRGWGLMQSRQGRVHFMCLLFPTPENQK